MRTIVLLITMISYPAFAAPEGLQIACQSGIESFIEKIDREPELLDLRDHYNSNMLHAAAICHNKSVFGYILKKRPQFVKQLNSWGESPADYQNTILLKKQYFSFTGKSKNSNLESIIQGSIGGATTLVSVMLLSIASVRTAKFFFPLLEKFDRYVMSDVAALSLSAALGSVIGSYLFHKTGMTYDRIRNQQRLSYLSTFFYL